MPCEATFFKTCEHSFISTLADFSDMVPYQGWQQSLIHFLKLWARRRSLKCVAWCGCGCIGRYGQWAHSIRIPFGWLGQWLLSTRRKVAGWIQRHAGDILSYLEFSWQLSEYMWRPMCRFESLVWQAWPCLQCLLSWFDWLALQLNWMVFAGAFKRPSFGNGEAPRGQ